MIKWKGKYYNNYIVLICIFLPGLIGIMISTLVDKNYALLIYSALALLIMIMSFLFIGTEYICFGETSYFYRKNIFCKEVEIEYKFVDNVILDFGTALYSGLRPCSNPGNVVYFIRNKALMHAAHMEMEKTFIKELIPHFSKKQIKILVNINAKIWGLPKKYHKLLYPYLSPKDKKAFDKRFGEEYIKKLND